VNTTAAGVGSITFISDTSAILDYNYDGLSGSLDLVRFTYGSYAMDGAFVIATTFIRSQCQNTSLNFVTYDGVIATITSDGKAFLIDQLDPSCTGSTDLTQTGSVFEGAGTWTCLSGESGTITFSDLRMSENHFISNYTQIWTDGETCQETGLISGLKIP
jgi:hypothetical protein